MNYLTPDYRFQEVDEKEKGPEEINFIVKFIKRNKILYGTKWWQCDLFGGGVMWKGFHLMKSALLYYYVIPACTRNCLSTYRPTKTCLFCFRCCFFIAGLILRDFHNILSKMDNE